MPIGTSDPRGEGAVRSTLGIGTELWSQSLVSRKDWAKNWNDELLKPKLHVYMWAELPAYRENRLTNFVERKLINYSLLSRWHWQPTSLFLFVYFRISEQELSYRKQTAR